MCTDTSFASKVDIGSKVLLSLTSTSCTLNSNYSVDIISMIILPEASIEAEAATQPLQSFLLLWPGLSLNLNLYQLHDFQCDSQPGSKTL